MLHSRTARGGIWPAIAGCAALGFAVLSLSGFAVGVAARHASSARAERVKNLDTLARLATAERARVGHARFNAGTVAGMSHALSTLERSTPNNARLDALIDSTMSAVLLARQGRFRAARAVFGRVSTAATNAAVAEAAIDPSAHKGVLERLQEQSAAIAAVLGSLMGLLILIAMPRRRGTRDRTVEALTEQARTDNLTGLGNQRAFQEAMSAAIAERTANGSPFVVLAIDLDGLKQINDTLGHIAGDSRIKEVAECIRRVVGSRGAVHRTGGDEFMVILPGQRNIHGLAIARRIDQETRTAVGWRAVSIGLTESIAAEGRLMIVGQADLALYESKRTRRNAVVFSPGLVKPVDAVELRQTTGPSQEQRALGAALARAVDAKDVGTQSHGETVAQLCVAIGERIGLAGHRLERLRLAGLLHDVGKIGIADAILQKPRPLNNDERAAMADHVTIGNAILLAAELPVEAGWVLHHHERYDGSGYPACLRAAEIPLESRIIAVADAYEAMTGDRPYREGVSVEDAVEELRRNVGSQFDGRCFNALVQAIEENAVDLRARRASRLSLVTVRPELEAERDTATARMALISGGRGTAQPQEHAVPSQGAARLKL